jgi:hypothetical protein
MYIIQHENSRADGSRAVYDEKRLLLGVNEKSALAIFPETLLQLTRDFSLDGMHLILKGIFLKMVKLLLSEKCDARFNIRHRPNVFAEFQHRMHSVKLPPFMKKPSRIASGKVSALTADEVFTNLRVYSLISIRELVDKEVFNVFVLASKLFSGLLHWQVSTTWVHSDQMSDLLESFLRQYHLVYGSCHCPPNFHHLLHSKV